MRTTMSADVLARTRQLVEPALAAAVDRLSPGVRPMAQYHFGWRDPSGRPVKGGGGKGVRGALAVMSAEAVWADPIVGVPGAVAVELVHNFSLIHDDIIDVDRERRHRPTVWAVYGIGPAICVGDALLTLAHQVLLESADPSSRAAALCLGEASGTMITGQVDDLSLGAAANVTPDESMAMCGRKTGALMACAASIGAILAGAPRETIAALRAFGSHLGLAFQATDDVLAIWGDSGRTGKAVGNDLRLAKKSLPVTAALASGTPAAEELGAMLRADVLLDDWQVKRAAELVELCGGRDWALGVAEANLEAAVTALEAAGICTTTQEQLVELATFVVHRDH